MTGPGRPHPFNPAYRTLLEQTQKASARRHARILELEARVAELEAQRPAWLREHEPPQDRIYIG